MSEIVPQAVAQTAGGASAPCRTFFVLPGAEGTKTAEMLGDRG